MCHCLNTGQTACALTCRFVSKEGVDRGDDCMNNGCVKELTQHSGGYISGFSPSIDSVDQAILQTIAKLHKIC